jgi:hypothetical protein
MGIGASLLVVLGCMVVVSIPIVMHRGAPSTALSLQSQASVRTARSLVLGPSDLEPGWQTLTRGRLTADDFPNATLPVGLRDTYYAALRFPHADQEFYLSTKVVVFQNDSIAHAYFLNAAAPASNRSVDRGFGDEGRYWTDPDGAAFGITEEHAWFRHGAAVYDLVLRFAYSDGKDSRVPDLVGKLMGRAS